MEGRAFYICRYDALEGHVVRGAEWFILAKEHHTGRVRFTIEARWRPGPLPIWWTGLGFRLFGGLYRDLWRRRAIHRLRRLSGVE